MIEHFDDGNGIPRLATVFGIGYHRDRDDSGCGRYGIGMKNAIIVLGEDIRFKTVCDGSSNRCTYDVNQLMRDDEFRNEGRPTACVITRTN